jgi:hypothetical protein
MVPTNRDTKSRIDHASSEPDERSVVREKGDDFHLCRSRMKRQRGIKLRGTTTLTTLRYREDDGCPEQKGCRASAHSVSGRRFLQSPQLTDQESQGARPDSGADGDEQCAVRRECIVNTSTRARRANQEARVFDSRSDGSSDGCQLYLTCVQTTMIDGFRQAGRICRFHTRTERGRIDFSCELGVLTMSKVSSRSART